MRCDNMLARALRIQTCQRGVESCQSCEHQGLDRVTCSLRKKWPSNVSGCETEVTSVSVLPASGSKAKCVNNSSKDNSMHFRVSTSIRFISYFIKYLTILSFLLCYSLPLSCLNKMIECVVIGNNCQREVAK